MTVRFGSRPSNGTMGDIQRSYTCNRCQVDHAGGWYDGRDDGESCPIILDALVGEHSYPNEQGPPQWGYDDETGEWSCTEFQGPCVCGREAPAT